MPYLSMTRTTGVGSRLLVLFVKMKERKDCMTRRMREKYSDEKCFNQPKNITRYDFGIARMPVTSYNGRRKGVSEEEEGNLLAATRCGVYSAGGEAGSRRQS
jgi:hypothetical protein